MFKQINEMKTVSDQLHSKEMLWAEKLHMQKLAALKKQGAEIGTQANFGHDGNFSSMKTLSIFLFKLPP